jgi:hypothetical protein
VIGSVPGSGDILVTKAHGSYFHDTRKPVDKTTITFKFKI